MAGRIWREYYPQIISSAQIEYMLERMYSISRLQQDLIEQVDYVLLKNPDGFCGFAAYSALSDSELRLHKLYVEQRCRGAGGGRALLEHIEAVARRRRFRTVTLTVNKRNERALKVYQRFGFRIIESVSVDIGNGFVMDDYILAKRVNST